MYIFCMIITVFFAIIGLCAFITAIIGAVTHSGDDEVILLVSDMDESTAEMRIRKAAHICTCTRNSRVICVCDEDNGAIRICEMLRRQYPFIEVVSRTELQSSI